MSQSIFTTVLVGEAHPQYVKLQRADHPDQRRRSVDWPKHLHDTLLGQFLQRLLQLLGLHSVGQANSAQDLGRKTRYAHEVEILAFGQGVADAHGAVVGNADHVAGMGLLGQRTILSKEELRRAAG